LEIETLPSARADGMRFASTRSLGAISDSGTGNNVVHHRHFGRKTAATENQSEEPGLTEAQEPWEPEPPLPPQSVVRQAGQLSPEDMEAQRQRYIEGNRLPSV
jgi:hypothetical protein